MTSHIRLVVVFAALLLTVPVLAQQPATGPRQFPPGSVTRFDQLPSRSAEAVTTVNAHLILSPIAKVCGCVVLDQPQ